MAINVHASGNADPENNPNANPSLDLSAVSLPQNVALYGWAEDTADAGATWTWNWTLMDGPDGHTASLDDNTVQNPTLEGVDVLGNYLLFLQATNTNTSPTASESDPLRAPTTAFVVVKCLTANQGLQKPAQGERGWVEAYHDLVDAVEGMGGPGAHSITDHTDIVDATGAQIEILTGGGVAEESSNPLHLHDGDHITAATEVVRGTVRLEAAATDVADPVVCNQDLVTFNAFVDQHFNDDTPNDVWVDGLNITDGSGAALYGAAWRIPWGYQVVEWSVSLGQRGVASGGAGSLVLALYQGTEAWYEAGIMLEIDTITIAQTITDSPAFAKSTAGTPPYAFPHTGSAGELLAVGIKSNSATLQLPRHAHFTAVVRRLVA